MGLRWGYVSLRIASGGISFSVGPEGENPNSCLNSSSSRSSCRILSPLMTLLTSCEGEWVRGYPSRRRWPAYLKIQCLIFHECLGQLGREPSRGQSRLQGGTRRRTFSSSSFFPSRRVFARAKPSTMRLKPQ